MSKFRAGVCAFAMVVAVAGGLVNDLSSPGAEASVASGQGVYRGAANPAGVAGFESWSGSSTPWALDFFAGAKWTDIESPGWWLDGWAGSGRQVVYSVPIIPDSGGTLEEGASGAYNVHFQRLAQLMVAKGQGSAVLRPGWEFNGGWFRWSAAKNPEAFAAYWRQIVTSMRSVSGAAFRFDWSPNRGEWAFALERAYPGDAYVDYIGMDSYDHSWIANYTDPAARWNDYLTMPYGLNWHRDFAAAHGKPMTYPEWGLSKRPDGHGGGDAPYFIEKMHQWISANNVAYHLYFDYDSDDGLHAITAGHFPNAANKFKALFGAQASPSGWVNWQPLDGRLRSGPGRVLTGS